MVELCNYKQNGSILSLQIVLVLQLKASQRLNFVKQTNG